MISKKMVTTYLIAIMIASFLSVNGVEDADGINGSFGGGNGKLSNPYIIEDVWDLQAMSSHLRAHYVLKNDIDASATKTWNSGEGFTPVGSETKKFTGSLDGRGFNITGLFINRSSSNVGLIGYLETDFSVKNICLKIVNVTGFAYVGALVGRIYSGSLSNCSVNGIIIGSNAGSLVGNNYFGTMIRCSANGLVGGPTNGVVGGLTGRNYNGIIQNCNSSCVVRGRDNIGGLAGANQYGSIQNSHATGTVEGISYVGGLLGYSYLGSVSNCTASGDTSGTRDYVGGLIGQGMEDSVVSNCSAAGDVNGRTYVGGLMGKNEERIVDCTASGNVTGSSAVGGLLGENYLDASIARSYATGNVTASGWNVGGLLGKNYGGTVSDSYSHGSVIGDSLVGGLIGEVQGVVSDSYSIGSVIGNSYVGGLVGNNRMEGAISNCFWDIETSGKSRGIGGGSNVGATGKTTSEMMILNTFVGGGWDIAHVRNNTSETWYIDDTYDYPHLSWEGFFDTIPPIANAGVDQRINMGDNVRFDGSDSKDNIGIVNFTWTFRDSGNITLYSISPSYKFDEAGVYIVVLNVSDEAGQWDTDPICITVIDTQPPVCLGCRDGPNNKRRDTGLIEWCGVLG
jgi:hypothetical protein